MRIRDFTHGFTAVALLVVFTACGESNTEGDDQFLAYPHRTCTSGGKGLKSGGKIKGGDIAAGEGSFCDGQFKQSGGRVAFRIFPNSRMEYERHKGNLYLRLARGRMLIDAEKRRAGGKIFLQAPGTMVRMLGTKVFMTKKDDSTLDVELLEGKVQVRSAPYLHLNNFRRGLSEKLERTAAQSMPELFESKVVFLEPGTSARVSASNHPVAVSSALRGKLERTFTQAGIHKAAMDKGADPAEFGKRVKEAARKSIGDDQATATKMQTNVVRVRKTIIDGKRRWLHARWSRNLLHIPSGATSAERLKVLLKRRYGGETSESILKDLRKKAAPGLLYKIFLKDGRVFQGRAEQEGARYRLVTRKGDIVIAKDRVEKIEILVPKN